MNIFSGSILDYLFWFGFFVLSLGFSLYLYSNSELTNFKKAILVTLRTVSLFLMLLLLLNPFIEYVKQNILKPQNIILIDNSHSNRIENRDSAIKDVLSNTTKGENNFLYYTFGSKIIKEIKDYKPDSTEDYKYSTNLASAFDDIYNKNEKQINSVSIISDGIINEGNNFVQTAYKIKAPIHYRLIGDTSQRKDLILQKVNFNKTHFTNSKSKIYVSINAYLTDKEIKLTLFENDVKIQTNNLFVKSSNSLYETSFEVSSTIQDIKKYRVEIESDPDEITSINNSEIFYINYIDNSIKILVIAGSPSQDVSSIRQVLNQSENFKYDVRIQKNGNEFYDGAMPKFIDYDIVTLVGFPTEVTSNEILSSIKENIKNAKIPLIFFNSSNLSFGKLKEITEIIPFVYNEIGKSEIKGSVLFTPNNINENTDSFRKLKLLPPSFFYRGAFSSKPNSTILGIQNNEPAIVIDNSSPVKSVAFLGYGFWKWNLSPNGNYDYLRNLISGFISLCINEDSKEKFSIKCDKDSYAVSEPIEFLAYYKDIVPTKKYSVRLNIMNKGKVSNLDLSRFGENNFQGQFQLFEKNDYSVKADLYEDNVLIQTKSLKFSVSDATKEYKETKATDKTLKELSNITGGINLSGKNKSEIDSIFKSNNKIENNYLNKSLFRYSLLYLILIIVLLSIEWYIRKRLNLA